LSEQHLPNKFIQIDEQGYFHFGENRVSDPKDGFSLFSNLKILESGHFVTQSEGQAVLVEAFDEPFIALGITKKDNQWQITLPYNFTSAIDISSFSLDEWDRFHGNTTSGIPFVLSRSAQASFFNLVDEYDDDSIVINGERLQTGPWLNPNPDTINESFWTNIYNTEDPGWDLKIPHPALESTMNQIKLSKCRILNLGCGTGTDANYLASLGHIVTGVDMSPEAIKRANEKYSHVKNLNFVQKDIFDVTPEELGKFDLIFEHTLYCAISPERRNKLTQVWKKMLSDNGQLLGIFFSMNKRIGPPFGGSEWEIKKRLKKDYRFLYWTRCKKSPGKRLGKELIVFAERH